MLRTIKRVFRHSRFSLIPHNAIAFLLFIVSLIAVTSPACRKKSCDTPLPYYGARVPVFSKDSAIVDSVIHSVPEFVLTDQNGNAFASGQLDGKVYVVDFIFTSCPSICPLMTRQMNRLRSMTDTSNVYLLSITVDPKRDTPEALRDYIAQNSLNTVNWYFLTGKAKEIYPLGWYGFKLSMAVNKSSPGGFIHSEKFVLIDANGHIRGFYDGTNSVEVQELALDIACLLQEKNGNG